MAVIQVNPANLPSTSEGYISSITIRTAGAPAVLVPHATTGQVTVSALAATQLVQQINKISLISG
jgi:hypothetical protein